ncbi:polysaccharide biosynthesis protein [Frankia sp. CiP3]|uniref:polysaccharide biosynthesis protein n=1 Tax=Frankia sp. CiP3 TaxID=2880971 RepID=UPI001EF48839|nr:polysaccharide biosynthesis protein [Frankia sp. CiP3]
MRGLTVFGRWPLSVHWGPQPRENGKKKHNCTPVGNPQGFFDRPASSQQGLRTLVVGAGAAGRTLIRDLRRVPDYGLQPVGLLDDKPAARPVARLPVLGGLADVRRIVIEQRIDAVLIAIPSLPSDRLRALTREVAATGVHIRYLPSFLAAVERDAFATDLRHPNLGTLLCRKERQVLQPTGRTAIVGKRVLVTGAGGSIGSELCRQLRNYEPMSVHMLDHDESNLHSLKLQLDGDALLDTDDLIIADIRDAERIHHVFRSIRPEVVFHAAAHKHLPLLERHPCEGAKSNVLGTHHLVQAACEHHTERFVLISTDKAADPRSVLGATKRLAEMIVQANAEGMVSACTVRFGNVLGSRGSFLNVVADQIGTGGPVTITHPEVTRFFMTAEEAVGLVLTAVSLAECGETFVLDMGEPVRIVDLVHNYAGQLHRPDIRIQYTGLRPGEKLHETLFSKSEQRLPTSDPAIWATRPEALPDNFAVRLEELYAASAADDSRRVRQLLSCLLPSYVPASTDTREFATALAAPYADDF